MRSRPPAWCGNSSAATASTAERKGQKHPPREGAFFCKKESSGDFSIGEKYSTLYRICKRPGTGTKYLSYTFYEVMAGWYGMW